MAEHETSRTLVKSPPELWAECSDPASLARHLDGFGEIRITRLEPETAVAWEGERASGTVRLEPAGWGTRVTLRATERPAAAAAAATAVGEPEPEAVEPTTAAGPASEPPRHGLFDRFFGLFRRGPAAAVEPPPAAAAQGETAGGSPVTAAPPEPAAPAAPEPAAPAAPPEPQLLSAALDSLGRAHHRPYSRS